MLSGIPITISAVLIALYRIADNFGVRKSPIFTHCSKSKRSAKCSDTNCLFDCPDVFVQMFLSGWLLSRCFCPDVFVQMLSVQMAFAHWLLFRWPLSRWLCLGCFYPDGLCPDGLCPDGLCAEVALFML